MIGVRLIEFLNLYNFRYIQESEYEDVRHDTNTIRIYYRTKVDTGLIDNSAWFELGINDWAGKLYSSEILNEVINKDILNMYVVSFEIEDETSVLKVFLQKDKDVLD